MYDTFDSKASNETRALQIWQILIGVAHNRQTIPYGRLAKLLGFKGAGVMAGMLGHVACYCVVNDLPALTVLVVNPKTGAPSSGIEGAVEVEDFDTERERVFGRDWFGIYPPNT